MRKKYIAVLRPEDQSHNTAHEYAKVLAPAIDREIFLLPLNSSAWGCDAFWNELIEQYDISFVLFTIGSTGISLRRTLTNLHHLRIPYLALPSTLIHFSIPQQFIVPVGVLPEEKEKGVFSSALAKKTGASVLLITAKAYGSRARSNTEAVHTLLKKQQIEVKLLEGKKPSEKVDFEGLHLSKGDSQSLLWILATREYALDDLFFGTKELCLLRKCHIPVMIINPRGDLYAFCE